MNENTRVAPPDEEYEDVEQKFLGNLRDNLGLASQYRFVFENIIPKIRDSAKKDRLSAFQYERRLQEAEEIIDDIAFALNTHSDKNEKGRIWFVPTLDSLQSRPEGWRDASPVHLSGLDTAAARYLQRPWMQVNLLDWYILNGYIFDEIARFADAIKSGSATGVINWAFVFSGGSLEKTLYWRATFAISKFAVRWVLIPAMITTVYYFGHDEIAKWMAIPYGVYLFTHLSLFPRRYLRRKALKKELKELDAKLRTLVNVYQSSSAEIFSPSRLREFIVRTEANEVFFRPAIYSILGRAVERDAELFCAR